MRTVCLMLSLVLLGGCAWGQEWEIEYLPEPLGATSSFAYATNTRGQIVGCCVVEGISTPVLWDGGKAYLLPIPGGYQDATASCINNSGLIVGTAYYIETGPFGDRTAICVWNNKLELVTIIEILQHTYVDAIDDDGIVYGHAFSRIYPSQYLYFTWSLQKGTICQTDLMERFIVYDIMRGDMVGSQQYHAVVVKCGKNAPTNKN